MEYRLLCYSFFSSPLSPDPQEEGEGREGKGNVSLQIITFRMLTCCPRAAFVFLAWLIMESTRSPASIRARDSLVAAAAAAAPGEWLTPIAGRLRESLFNSEITILFFLPPFSEFLILTE